MGRKRRGERMMEEERGEDKKEEKGERFRKVDRRETCQVLLGGSLVVQWRTENIPRGKQGTNQGGKTTACTS